MSLGLSGSDCYQTRITLCCSMCWKTKYSVIRNVTTNIVYVFMHPIHKQFLHLDSECVTQRIEAESRFLSPVTIRITKEAFSE